MNFLQRKTWMNLIATILVALALFSVSMALAHAASPDQQYSIATVAEKLTGTKLEYYLFIIIAGLGSFIAWIGGMIFDLAISVFTVGMAEFSRALGLTKAVEDIWSIVRDLFNLLFIFGLIYAGFKIIIDANDSNSKRTVGMIVLAALLINFSLYAAQVVVDFTNIAAAEIHELIAPDIAGNEKLSIGGIDIPIHNASSQFFLLSGLQNQRDSINEKINPLTGGQSILKAVILGFIFLIFYSILGFVLAACAIVLFTRFFALIFLMMFSPLMFLGWVLPSMKGQSSKWWQYFSSQALVGPAMIFMIYVSLRALQGLKGDAGDIGLIGIIAYLLVVVAFLLASLRVAKSFGAYGASMTMNVGQRWGNAARGYAGRAAGGATFGLAARGGRYAIGKRAQTYAESDEARDAAANSWWGRRKLNLATKLGDASFDARNTGAGRKLGLGSGIKGYKSRTEEIAKREKEYAKKLGEVSDEDQRVKELQIDMDSYDQAIKAQKEEVRKKRAEGADRATVEIERAKLEEMEEKQVKAKEKLQQEKQRRQLGVVPSTGQAAYWNTMVEQKKEAIKEDVKKYAEMKEGDPNRAAFQKRILENKKEQAEYEKNRDSLVGGYAASVQNSGLIKNFFLGRNKAQNDNAAKEIRDEFKKKVKGKEKKDNDKSEAKKEDKKEEAA